MATIKKSLKKAKDGDLLNRVSKTKLKDVPKKVKNIGNKVVNKVKNTTVGKAASAVASTTPIGMAYNLAKKAANTETGKQIKEDLKPERIKKGLKNIKSALGLKRGGTVKKKMRNGGSLTSLKASTKRDKGIDPKGAWTKVQEKTLRGAKGKAKLTADKQLGATKMKMGGKMAKKGTSVKKAGFGDILGKAAGSGMFGLAGLAAKKKMGYGGKAASMVPPKKRTMKMGGTVKKAMMGTMAAPMMKKGGTMKKCKYGCK